jgi:hypothetical protein
MLRWVDRLSAGATGTRRDAHDAAVSSRLREKRLVLPSARFIVAELSARPIALRDRLERSAGSAQPYRTTNCRQRAYALVKHGAIEFRWCDRGAS